MIGVLEIRKDGINIAEAARYETTKAQRRIILRRR